MPNGSYTVVPTHAQYTFSPLTQPVSVTSVSLTGINFTATNVNQPPQVGILPSPVPPITLPDSVTLAGHVADDMLPTPPGRLTVTWSQVSGQGTATFSNPSGYVTGSGTLITQVSFSAAGTYTVRLTASDGLLSASAEVTIMVNPNQPPTARLTASPTSGVVSLWVIFDGSGSNDPEGTALTYLWDFGDGVVLSGSFSNAGHLYTTAGTYTATLIVQDGAGLQSKSASIMITVTQPLSASLTANGGASLDVWAGNSITYVWSSTGAVRASSTYTVSPAADSCGSGGTGPFPWVANSLAGLTTATVADCQRGHSYTITYTVESASGQTQSASVTIFVQ